ncbi:phosphatase PAP2 family protein [Phenylobacterium sp.]|uniref:acid phosphatase n=1 Tax=Phenylobacterium sp. TaxID=1871053 RepID=UPI002CC59CDC|nr:phosphatase PAP2 family protein [Phenylobacterium sp.]HLZ74371.1 phosphatase PAP2 family protein [Phenylobacterium sp.]
MAWKLVMAVTAAAVLTMGADPAPPSAMPPPPAIKPYLGAAGLPDTLKILPPAPQKGDIRYETDRKMFLGTRKLAGTPRFALALNDDALSGQALMKDFSCALGVELTAANAPKFMSMIPRIGRDASTATNLPKDYWKRQRPFLIDKGPTCIDQNGPIKDTLDYPSGHNTYSWAVGLILAELAPDRATEILVRARAYGESRMVCGVHNMSAVENGRTNGGILVAALHSSPEFRADIETVRAEIAKARKAGPAPDPAACAKEAELLTSPY